MKKRDLIIIGAVVLLACVGLLALSLAQKTRAYVTVYVHDEVYACVPVTDYQTLTVDQGEGKVNVIRIDEQGVCMESSTCKNQLCVHQGTIDPKDMGELLLSNWIVCLPNGVTIELSEQER